MRRNAVLSTMAAVLVSALNPALGMAQHMGLQIGIAQPQFTSTPTAPAPVVAVRNTLGIPTIVAPALLVPVVPLVPNFPTVIVPNQVLRPGQTTVSAQPVPQGPPRGPGLRHGPPPRGTPRADVLQQFGQPSVTIITSTGETLYFTGGVTVILQNGQVAGPR
jgi:hypothetical protein